MRQDPDATHAGRFHAVQFYKDDASLISIVARFLAEGFAKGDPVVAIATPRHRAAIEADLRKRSLDVDGLKRLGDLVLLDASETLATFVVDVCRTPPRSATSSAPNLPSWADVFVIEPPRGGRRRARFPPRCAGRASP